VILPTFVVEEIKHVGAELNSQSPTLKRCKVLREADIRVEIARADQAVSPAVAELSIGWGGKRIRIEITA
jgi:hypothetical protein